MLGIRRFLEGMFVLKNGLFSTLVCGIHFDNLDGKSHGAL